MEKHNTTPLILEIAKSFVAMVQKIEPNWKNAYFRFVSDGTSREAKSSYVHAAGISIINVLKHKDFFHPVLDKGRGLLDLLEKHGEFFYLRWILDFTMK